MRVRRSLLLVLLFGLTACASTPRMEPETERRQITAFTVQGRIALQRGDQHASGGLWWQHGRQRDTLEMLSPLGQVVALLDCEEKGCVLRDSSGRQWAAPDADALARKALGLSLPLGEMADWLLGRVAGEVTRDGLGRPVRAKAEGWQIEWRDYLAETAQALPGRLVAERGDVRLHLKVTEWQSGEAP